MPVHVSTKLLANCVQNTCVDFANEATQEAATASHAQLRQCARSAVKICLNSLVLAMLLVNFTVASEISSEHTD